jgi:hypothetical protein
MESIEEMCSKEQASIKQDQAVNEAKLAFIPVVAAALKDCLGRLTDQMPDSAQLNISGWQCSHKETPTITGSINLHYPDQKSMKDSATVLEALDGVAPLETWSNYDIAAYLIRSFSSQYLTEESAAAEHTIYLHVYWSVTEGLESGCFKRLVRIDTERTERETPVYEIVCGDAA